MIRLTETGSTMDLAWRLASDGAPSGTTVLAGRQTAGRGRAGRPWTTAPGTSILLSFVADTARDPADFGLVSLVLGLAVSRTVRALAGVETAIKWPNDVLVGGQKVGGILATSRVLPGRDGRCLVAGVGLNVNDGPADLPATGTSLAIVSGFTYHLDDVLGTLLANLNDAMHRFEDGSTAASLEAIHDQLAFRGERVRLEDAERIVEGVLRGVTNQGLLELDVAPGESVTVASGELTRGPVPMG